MEDFDALITGHLTHYAIWYDNVLNAITLTYFNLTDSDKGELFEKNFLGGLNANAEKKAQLVKDIVVSLKQPQLLVRTTKLLDQLQKFKQVRNIMAHGLLDDENSSAEPLKISVYLNNFKEKLPTVDFTQESFDQYLEEATLLLSSFEEIAKEVGLLVKVQTSGN